MRNSELEKLDWLVGEWTTNLTNAWFLEPKGTEISGTTSIEWLGESFLIMRTKLGGDQHSHSESCFVLGHSDPHHQFIALYHDDRGVCRQYAMTFDGQSWTMTRNDPDFYQRFIAELEQNRIKGRWEASEDQGKTWRKDFDLTFERIGST